MAICCVCKKPRAKGAIFGDNFPADFQPRYSLGKGEHVYMHRKCAEPYRDKIEILGNTAWWKPSLLETERAINHDSY